MAQTTSGAATNVPCDIGCLYTTSCNTDVVKMPKMLQKPKKTKLAYNADGVGLVRQHAVNMLDGDLFACILVLCRAESSSTRLVRTVPQ